MTENQNHQNPQAPENLTSTLSAQPLLTTAVAEQLLQATQQIVNTQTTKPTLIQKLQSRKFWMAVLGAVSGVCGMLNSGDNVVAIGIFVALTAVSVLGYCFGEGTIDASRTKEFMDVANQLAAILSTVITVPDGGTDTLEPSGESDDKATTESSFDSIMNPFSIDSNTENAQDE